jgi:hypothetical protein
MAYLIMAGTTVTAALAQSAGPRLSRRFADGDVAGFRRLLLKMMAIGAAMGAVGVLISLLAGRQVLSLLYRPEYAVAARALVWVSVAGTIAYVASFLNTAMVTVRASRTQAALFGVVAAVGLVGCALLVPRYGLTGAAWAAGLSFAVQLGGAALIVTRSLRRRSRNLATPATAAGVGTMTTTTTTTNLYEGGQYLERNPTWHVEDSPWKAQQVLKMLRRRDLRPKTVCEIGCGAGEILRQLHDQMDADARFTGFEISPQAHALSRQRSTDRLEFRLQDPLSETSRPQDAFDMVLAMDVVEHVEDYFGFLRRLKGLGTYKVFHIPLDISAYSAMGPTLMRGRQAMGHIQYFTRATALATLRECGYEVVDHFYTFGAIEAPGAPNKSAAAKALRIARRMLYYVNKELMVRVLGGASVLVLAK